MRRTTGEPATGSGRLRVVWSRVWERTQPGKLWTNQRGPADPGPPLEATCQRQNSSNERWRKVPSDYSHSPSRHVDDRVGGQLQTRAPPTTLLDDSDALIRKPARQS
ncbi:unnamed protein product [Pleuronectes platessa]|uniref:Uncharacterized protein n=1 Tax=Pleuronectes platessa TaxID=8262 RepID=A0A9N7YP95_PLEPL|nr:unnamed protein product [Pleuronectes platessa]